MDLQHISTNPQCILLHHIILDCLPFNKSNMRHVQSLYNYQLTFSLAFPAVL